MKNRLVAAAALAMLSSVAAPAMAQQASISQSIAATRLDVSATGEVTRAPDVALVSAGVTTHASTAGSALQQTAARMVRVRSALKNAGIDDRDIQTGNISLNPEYRYDNGQPPVLTGYTASNMMNVRFRDIASAGKVIDALVTQGANQINGPTLSVDKPEAALDEARAKAVAAGRARAELYARTMGLRVVRVVAVSESGGTYAELRPMVMMAARAEKADTSIDAGEQKLQVTLNMTFELQ